jgi:hypothetical protein
MQQILNDISKKHPYVIAVILYGGYGRNEGGWLVERNGSYKPYNDYDIYLWLKKKIMKKRLKHYAEI